MVFKVVRTDTSDPRKIQLLVGTHLIGRGNLLDCDDKRVSRRHGELEVTQDSVSIKSLHSNPCFYIRRSTDETVILKQECTVNLSQGDKFGLLPHTYWYELLHCMPEAGDSSSITEDVKKEINNTDNVNYEANTEDQVEKSRNGSTDNIQNTQSNKSELNGLDEDPDMSQPLSLELNDTVDKDNKALESPSLIPTDTPTFNNDIVNEPSNVVASNDDQNVEAKILKRNNSVTTDDCSPVDIKKVKAEPDDTQDVKPGPSNDEAPSSPDKNVEAKIIKRSNSVKSDDCSSVDAECESAESDDSQDAKPGPSNAQVAFSDSPQSPDKPAARERCIYGENCYRRNPQHKSEFSHPRDADWGDAERGVCPYGRACRRRDPRHWRHHTHPAGAEPPAARDAPRPGVKKPRRRKDYSQDDKSDSEDENGSVKALIITGKRVRKTIAKPSYSGSESGNDDPYQTDPESDEWQPGSNDLLSTQSYSQNTEE